MQQGAQSVLERSVAEAIATTIVEASWSGWGVFDTDTGKIVDGQYAILSVQVAIGGNRYDPAIMVGSRASRALLEAAGASRPEELNGRPITAYYYLSTLKRIELR